MCEYEGRCEFVPKQPNIRAKTSIEFHFFRDIVKSSAWRSSGIQAAIWSFGCFTSIPSLNCIPSTTLPSFLNPLRRRQHLSAHSPSLCTSCAGGSGALWNASCGAGSSRTSTRSGWRRGFLRQLLGSLRIPIAIGIDKRLERGLGTVPHLAIQICCGGISTERNAAGGSRKLSCASSETGLFLLMSGMPLWFDRQIL